MAVGFFFSWRPILGEGVAARAMMNGSTHNRALFPAHII
jgi:hypothetical protein